jgi:DNA-binding HxlR family transcriptional regulator
MQISRKRLCSPSVQVAQVVEEIIGCKWSISVLVCVRSGVLRPGAMEHFIPGISAKVLNQRLRRFLTFGILEKSVLPERPYHVEYHLTEFGKRFMRVLDVVDELQHYVDSRTDGQLQVERTGRQHRANLG